MHLGLTREHGEPHEGYEPMPLWLPTLIVGLLVWAGYYIGRYGGTFDANSYDPVTIEEGAGSGNGASQGSPMDRGKNVFVSTCVSCHQTNGEGVPDQYPPLAGSSVVTGDSKKLVQIILHGLNGPLVIGGKRYDGSMPAWAGTLDDAQVADVSTYIRKSWGNKGDEVTPDQVKAIRAATSGRGQPWTAAELGLPH
ncbi:MAG: hypothetical protein A2X94_13095 [Bdellovibrionales bacterium GWB1_55_8]|nr:MAG: hypothetical protein A2X94_13095 [Bdellovibrionales bacterium GWB1_55_8]